MKVGGPEKPLKGLSEVAFGRTHLHKWEVLYIMRMKKGAASAGDWLGIE